MIFTDLLTNELNGMDVNYFIMRNTVFLCISWWRYKYLFQDIVFLLTKEFMETVHKTFSSLCESLPFNDLNEVNIVSFFKAHLEYLLVPSTCSEGLHSFPAFLLKYLTLCNITWKVHRSICIKLAEDKILVMTYEPIFSKNLNWK